MLTSKHYVTRGDPGIASTSEPPAPQKLVPIRFTQRWTRFKAGESTLVLPEEASSLVGQGIAETM